MSKGIRRVRSQGHKTGRLLSEVKGVAGRGGRGSHKNTEETSDWKAKDKLLKKIFG